MKQGAIEKLKQALIVFNIIFLGLFLITFLVPSSIKAIGQIPNNCLTLSNNNPRHTPYCNPSCTSNNCITYCKAGSAGAKILVTKDVKDIIIKYKAPTHPIQIVVPGTSINKYVSCSGGACIGQVKDTSGKIFHKGDTLTIIVTDNEGYAIGFRAPDSNNICGENNICREDGGKYGNPEYYETFSIADIVNAPNGYSMLSKQCYGDSPIGDSDFDFNDYALVVFGKPINGPTPTPTPTPTPPYLLLCKDLVAQGNTGKDDKMRMYDFTCKVNKEADKCKLKVDGKTLTANVNNNHECFFEYTFTKSGDYSVICYAVDSGSKYEVTSDNCKTLIHIPEDSAGGYIFPLIIAVSSALMISFTTFGRDFRIKI